MAREQEIEVTVNGQVYTKRVSVRVSLGDFLPVDRNFHLLFARHQLPPPARTRD